MKRRDLYIFCLQIKLKKWAIPPNPENPNLWEMLNWKKHFGVLLEILVTFALMPDSKRILSNENKIKTEKKENVWKKIEVCDLMAKKIRISDNRDQKRKEVAPKSS